VPSTRPGTLKEPAETVVAAVGELAATVVLAAELRSRAERAEVELGEAREPLSCPDVQLTLADRYILDALAQTVQRVDAAYRDFDFSEASDAIRSFAWNDVCDVYIEIAREVMRVARARRITPEGFNGFDPHAFSPDADRGNIVKAFVVLRAGHEPGAQVVLFRRFLGLAAVATAPGSAAGGKLRASTRVDHNDEEENTMKTRAAVAVEKAKPLEITEGGDLLYVVRMEPLVRNSVPVPDHTAPSAKPAMGPATSRGPRALPSTAMTTSGWLTGCRTACRCLIKMLSC